MFRVRGLGLVEFRGSLSSVFFKDFQFGMSRMSLANENWVFVVS